MSLETICLFQDEAQRLIDLQETNQGGQLQIKEKQELISIYSKVVETFDVVDPGIKHYFMHKLQLLVVRATQPPVLTERTSFARYKQSSGFMTRSKIGSQKGGVSNNAVGSKQNSKVGQISDDPGDIDRIEEQVSRLTQMKEHHQITIMQTLCSQQESITKRLQQRKNKKERRRSQQKKTETDFRTIRKEELRIMQKDLNNKIKRFTARMSRMESLKAFAQNLAKNPCELQKIRNLGVTDRIQEEDQDSEKQN